LISEYTKYGVIYSKSAKDIASILALPLSETYLTLQALQKEGLIWRVGKRNLYRYGLKEKKLATIYQLYNCYIKKKALPIEERINYNQLDQLIHYKQLLLKQKELEEAHQKDISMLLRSIEFLPEEECIEWIHKKVESIIKNYIEMIEEHEVNFSRYLEYELDEIWEYIIGAKITGGKI